MIVTIAANWRGLPDGLAIAKIRNRPAMPVVPEVGMAQTRRIMRRAAGLPDLRTATGAGLARRAGGVALNDGDAVCRVDNTDSYR